MTGSHPGARDPRGTDGYPDKIYEVHLGAINNADSESDQDEPVDQNGEDKVKNVERRPSGQIGAALRDKAVAGL